MLKPFTALLFGILAAACADKIESSFALDFEGWGNWNSENSVVQFRQDPGTGRTAPGSLSILLGPDHPEEKSACFTRHFKVQPGQTYTGLVYVKATGIANQAVVSLGFQGQDEKKNFLGTGVQSIHSKGLHFKSGEWKRLVYTIRVPDTGKWQQAALLLCTMGISHSGHGQIWFDDFLFFNEP